MNILLIGSTGMLGQALYKFFTYKNHKVTTVSRKKADINIDLLESCNLIRSIIIEEKYDIVINAAANINLLNCEENPGNAYKLNARIPSILSEACKISGSYFIQISTDHYYLNSNILHEETYPITLLNEYAKTKYFGEILTLQNPESLVIRTNIVGFRNASQPTFVEWIINQLENDNELFGYTDFFTSSIDVYSFSEILYQVILQNQTGILNIATKDVISKYEFIMRLSTLFGKTSLVKKGSLNDLNQNVKRGNTLGLSTNKLSNIIDSSLIPTSQQVINRLFSIYKGGHEYEI